MPSSARRRARGRTGAEYNRTQPRAPRSLGRRPVVGLPFSNPAARSCLSTPPPRRSARHVVRRVLAATGERLDVIDDIARAAERVSLTSNTYSHVLPALQHDAAARMNAVLER